MANVDLTTRVLVGLTVKMLTVKHFCFLRLLADQSVGQNVAVGGARQCRGEHFSMSPCTTDHIYMMLRR